MIYSSNTWESMATIINSRDFFILSLSQIQAILQQPLTKTSWERVKYPAERICSCEIYYKYRTKHMYKGIGIW